MTTQIFIVEDHTLMRQLLRQAVEKMPGLAVSGVASSAEEALDKLHNLEADLVLVDMSLPRMSGVELIRELRERSPALRFLVVSGHKETTYVEQTLAAGAHGYLLKGNPYEIPEAITQVLAGNTFLSAPLRTAWDADSHRYK